MSNSRREVKLDNLDRFQINQMCDSIDTLVKFMENPLSVKLLRQFMEERRSGDSNLAEQYLAVHEKCSELLKSDLGNFGRNEVKELLELGLPRDFELALLGVLNRSLNSSEKSRGIQIALLQTQNQCLLEIERSSDFREFKGIISRRKQALNRR